jgi:hypothetical protein
VRGIGIHFVGMKLFKIVAPGIVKYVEPAGIGGNGTVKGGNKCTYGVSLACEHCGVRRRR